MIAARRACGFIAENVGAAASPVVLPRASAWFCFLLIAVFCWVEQACERYGRADKGGRSCSGSYPDRLRRMPPPQSGTTHSRLNVLPAIRSNATPRQPRTTSCGPRLGCAPRLDLASSATDQAGRSRPVTHQVRTYPQVSTGPHLKHLSRLGQLRSWLGRPDLAAIQSATAGSCPWYAAVSPAGAQRRHQVMPIRAPPYIRPCP